MLREIKRILADDGILVLGVPNWASLMSHIMRSRWAGLLPDQHLWHFTPHTLQLMLDRAGLHIRELVVQPTAHHHPIWIRHIILRCITTIGNTLGRGESLVAIAQKSHDST
jgi:hypothetical protein